MQKLIILTLSMLLAVSDSHELNEAVDYYLNPESMQNYDYSWLVDSYDYQYDQQGQRMLKRGGGGRSSGSRSRSSYSSGSSSKSSYSYSGGKYSGVYGTTSSYGFSSYYRRTYTHFYYYSAGQACYPEDYECINEAKVDYTWLWILLGVFGFCCCGCCIYQIVKNKKKNLKRSDTNTSDVNQGQLSPRKDSCSSFSSDNTEKRQNKHTMPQESNQVSDPLNAPPIYQGTPIQQQMQPQAQMPPPMTMQPIQTTVDQSHPAYLPDDIRQMNAQNAANNAMMPPNGQQSTLPPISQQHLPPQQHQPMMQQPMPLQQQQPMMQQPMPMQQQPTPMQPINMPPPVDPLHQQQPLYQADPNSNNTAI